MKSENINEKYRNYSNWGTRYQGQILRGCLFSNIQSANIIVGSANIDNNSTHKEKSDYEPISSGH